MFDHLGYLGVPINKSHELNRLIAIFFKEVDP